MGCRAWDLTGEDPPCVLYWRDRAIHKRVAEADAERFHREHPNWRT